MDDRRSEIERIRAEIERELATGATVDPLAWLRRHPELQPELGEMLARMLGGQPTLGSPEPAPDPAPDPRQQETVAGFDPGEKTQPADPRPATGPEPTVALNNPAETVALGGTDSPIGSTPTLPAEPGSAESSPTVEMTGGRATEPTTALGATQPSGATSFFDPNAPASKGAGTKTEVERAAGQGAPAPGDRVRYIGDYELRTVLGRGGMGVVYRARQISLNRYVALKMIGNSEFASEEQVRRFQNEAEAVATLDHPGIVPIYEVGSYEDQRYFSMKLIEGRGMEKALTDLKANPREAARIVAEVADAVTHAHQRGILHRDLKPANILLDHEHHAHVTDFGLAKRIEAEEGMTVSGAVMGTPAYMSPEQAAGMTSAITTSSDVYGLGAILFAALTDRAPFVGNSLMMTLDRVRNNPPDPPRRLNPGVPADLEVICLKCLEKEPRHRYASAQELAADLRRWLAGEPIAARPVGPAVRLAMWARRKPALAGLSLALIVASIVGVIGIAWQWREAVYQRDRAQVARNEAVQQEGLARVAETQASTARDAAQASEKAAQVSEKAAVSARAEAEKNAQIAGVQSALALSTIQDLITRVNKDLTGPGLFDLKTRIIESALQRVDQVANVYQGSTSKEATALAGSMSLGRIYRETGRFQQALPIFQKALVIAKERMIIRNRNSSARDNLAQVYLELAACAEEIDRDMNVVIPHLKEAQALYEDILARPTNEAPNLTPAKIRERLAIVDTQLGLAHEHLGQNEPALEAYRRAYNVRVELLAAGNNDMELTLAVPLSLLTMANSSDRLGRRPAAEDYFRESLERYERVEREKPGDVRTQVGLAIYHVQHGVFHLRHDELGPARRDLETSRDLYDSLNDADRKMASYRRDLSFCHSQLGLIADLEKKPELARKEYDEALRLAEENLRVDEKNDLRKSDLMLLLARVGQGDRAVEIADVLAAGPKVDPELAIYLAQAYAQSARSLPPEKAERAQVLLVKAVEAVRQAVSKGFRDRAVLDHQHDLDPLRARDDFKALLRDLPPAG